MFIKCPQSITIVSSRSLLLDCQLHKEMHMTCSSTDDLQGSSKKDSGSKKECKVRAKRLRRGLVSHVATCTCQVPTHILIIIRKDLYFMIS